MISSFSQKDIDYLLSPLAIRQRTKRIYDLAAGGKTNFELHLEKLSEVSDYVLGVTRSNYPDLKIPFHSRNGHLNAGGISRIGQLESKLQKSSARDIAKAKIDLVVVSVLLDAGAGAGWTFFEESSAKTFQRSEGLAVASYHMFSAGLFSGDTHTPLRADSKGLKRLTDKDLEKHFQVTSKNPLIGTAGRVHLLNQLGRVIENHPTVFKTGRVGDLLDIMIERDGENISAQSVLDFVLRYFGDIWPSRIRLGQQSLGDVWSYSGFGEDDPLARLVPFHKLSQWLTYSLLVPMIEMGLQVTHVDQLTGLAEYRNGGLMIDSGLIELRDLSLAQKKFAPESDLVIEWRALTVTLLDLIGNEVRSQLKMSKEELPLAKILEGGTWHAGRRLAKEKRASGEPPINIISDGTVF